MPVRKNIGHNGSKTGFAVVGLNIWKCNDLATSDYPALHGNSIRTSTKL